MSVLVVGGDHVESFARVLNAAGFTRLRHWSGRKAGEHHQAIPQDTELVLMVIDQLNHGLVRSVRNAAEARGLPVIYSPRSRSRLIEALQRVRRSASVSGEREDGLDDMQRVVHMNAVPAVRQHLVAAAA